MAELTREEFARRVGLVGVSGSPEQAAQATNAAGITVPPVTQAALDEATRKLETSRVVRVAPSSRSEADIATKLGARPGVPFDVNKGVSFMQRLRVAAQPTPEEEQKALEAAYGEGNVRRNSFGWLVVTKKDEAGRTVDVLADPLGLDLGDAASVLGQLPEIGGALMTAIATRGASAAPGIWSAAKTLLATVGGAAVGGAAKDVAVRTAEGEPLRLGEVAERRGQLAAVDAVAGAGLGAGAKALGMFVSPLSATGPIQFEAKEAQRYFADKYGVRLSLTPAESTGNTFLQKAEAMQMQKPGASVPFERLLKRREEQLEDLRRIATGGVVPDEEEAGRRALDALGAKVAPLEQDVQRAAAAVKGTAERELAVIGGPVDKTALGQQVRVRAEELRAEFQAKSDQLYGDVFSDPRTQAKNISGDELAKEAKGLVDRLPTIEKEVPGPLLGPTGKPLPVTKKETLQEFVPNGVMAKLEALEQGQGQQFRLDELMQMRREVDNAIAQGEAIPGYQTRYLTQIRGFLSDRIRKGLEGIDPGLLAKWEKANDEYAKGVVKFKKAGIAEIFRESEQGSFLGDTALVDRVTGGGTKAQDVYRAYKDFFGPGSAEMTGIKQAIRDDVFGRDRIEGLVDAKGFINRLTQLAKDAPDAFQDAFGGQAAGLRNAARALTVAQGATLPEEELVRAVNSGNLSGRRLQEMLAAEETKSQGYRNELVKAVGEGNLKGDRIKPTEFVQRFVFNEHTQPKDLQGALALIQDRPDVLESVRRLTFKKALDQATAVVPATGRRVMDANELEKMLADENMVKRLKTALGSSTFDDLTQLTHFLKPGRVVQQAAKSAGGISAGQQISGLAETGALRYVERAFMNFFIATVYTSPPIRALVTNTVLGPRGKANLVNYVIASTPFLEAVADTYKDQAGRVLASMKASVDQSVRENPGEAELEPSREEFMRAIGAGE